MIHTTPMPSDKAECWKDPEFIAGKLKELGYETTSQELIDTDLMRLAAFGCQPSMLGLRVAVACKNANVKRPNNFAPSNIKHVSDAKKAALAAQARVPVEWLKTGRFKVPWSAREGGITYEGEDDSDAPKFLKPYIQLADDAKLIDEFVRLYSYEYRHLRDGTVKLAPWEYPREACRLLREAKDPARNDHFYKILPGGERPSICESIRSWPWVVPMLPIIWEAEAAWQRREHHLTITREELEWLIAGFGDGVLKPAIGRPLQTTHWLGAAERDPCIVERMHALHRKLLTVYDCEALPTFGGRERKGAGRRKKAK